MKTIIFLISVSFVIQIGFAQEKQLDFAVNKPFVPKKEHFNISSFQVEDECFLEMYGSVPNSMVCFYNKPSGGKLIKQEQLDNKGYLKATFEVDESPSFVLNSKRSIDGSVEGTGFVQYLGQKDFVVENIELVKTGNVIVLEFQSITNPSKNVVYQLKSTNERGEIKTIKTFYVSDEIEWETFSFEYKIEPRTFYTFEVKSKEKLRYKKTVYNSNGQADYSVYPTQAKNVLYVEYKEAIVKTPIRITNVQGNEVYRGELDAMKNEINISHLDVGSYFVTLEKYPNDTMPFVKK
ncbi:MAG: T9SS type A sorting domain-containing protein [Flavobacteriales bacterium]